jgi:hypothetical protein
MSNRPEDDDVARRYYERCRRAQELEPPEGAFYFDHYERSYQHYLDMKSRHQPGPYRPYGGAWKVGER